MIYFNRRRLEIVGVYGPNFVQYGSVNMGHLEYVARRWKPPATHRRDAIMFRLWVFRKWSDTTMGTSRFTQVWVLWTPALITQKSLQAAFHSGVICTQVRQLSPPSAKPLKYEGNTQKNSHTHAHTHTPRCRQRPCAPCRASRRCPSQKEIRLHHPRRRRRRLCRRGTCCSRCFCRGRRLWGRGSGGRG